MELRPATNDDIHWLATLWAHAFPGERSVAERARQLETGGAYGTIDDVRVAMVDGRAVGACKLHRMRMRVGGATLPLMGLASVAVAPEARRSGAGRELCRLALHEAKRRGDVLSALYAFRPAYYRALGYGLTGELLAFRFQPEQLRYRTAGDARLATADDYGDIVACYDRMLARAHGAIERGAATWQHHFGIADSHAFVLRDGERVCAYALIRYGSGPSREHRLMHVRELVADDDDAYDAMLGWIARQRDHWRHIAYEASRDEHFDLRLHDPRPPSHRPVRGLWDPVARVLRGPMLRLLDVRAAFAQRREWGNAPAGLRFSVHVRDAELGDNALPLDFEWDGHALCPRDSGGAPQTRLTIDAPALAQLYAGDITVEAACRLGEAHATGDVHALDTLFRCRRTFRLYDEF